MKGALFASKFSALSHVKLVDLAASTESMAYRTAEIERLSGDVLLNFLRCSEDLLSTSSLARSRASSSSWSNVTYRLSADILCPSRVSSPMGKWRKFMACFLYPRTHIATFDLKLCERLFDSDHVDDSISFLELVETVSDVPRRVESGPI